MLICTYMRTYIDIYIRTCVQPIIHNIYNIHIKHIKHTIHHIHHIIQYKCVLLKKYTIRKKKK